jgi:uncharacterized protein YndB with AHSA1/START domain
VEGHAGLNRAPARSPRKESTVKHAAAFCLLGLAAAVAAAPPDQGRVVTSSIVINSPAPEIFESFTTPEGIVRAWGVAKAKVDFRVGGTIRSAYQPDTDLDSPKAIVNTILAYEPDRMLAIKATAPEGSPDWLLAICETGWSVLRLEPLAPDRTRVTCTGMGYKEGPLFDQAHQFFQSGNDWTLEHMKKAFEGGAAASNRGALAVMENMLGGEWIAETAAPGGGTMLARTVWRRQAGGFLVVDGWLGNDQGMRPHAHFVCGEDPATGGVGFWSFGEHADIARGHVRLIGEGRVALDWTMDAPGENGTARRVPYHIEFTLEGTDAYRVAMWRAAEPPTAGTVPDIALVYRRVERAPEKFTRVAPHDPAATR